MPMPVAYYITVAFRPYFLQDVAQLSHRNE